MTPRARMACTARHGHPCLRPRDALCTSAAAKLARAQMPVGAQFEGVFLAAFADGRVYALPYSFSRDVLRGFITPAGNERVPQPGSLPPRARVQID